MGKRWLAEEANYYGTSRSAQAAIDTARKEIEKVGGEVTGYYYGEEKSQAAHVLSYAIEGKRFRALYPVLINKRGEYDQKAVIQAAVALKHHIKAQCVAMKWRGVLGAFGADLVLEDGRTMAELHAPELLSSYPRLGGPKG